MHSLPPPEAKLEEDPPPDELEKRIRIGCGALFGIIPGLWFAVGILGLRAGCPSCHCSCRLDRSVTLGREAMKWHDTDKHSKNAQ